ncbi:MAG: MFS transporter [Agarilytica sp.]
MIKNKYYVETLAFLSYVLFAMAWVGGTASMNHIMETMDVKGLASASFISGAVTMAKILGTFIAAWIAGKLGVKLAFLVASAMIALGFFTPRAPTYDLLLVSRFVMGLGGALMVVYFNPIVIKWFSPKERPIVNGLNSVAFNIGVCVVLFWFSDLSSALGGWKNVLTVFSIISVGLAMLFLLVDFSGSDNQQSSSTSANQDTYTYSEGLKSKFNWIYALSFTGILSLFICVFTFYPQAGISQTKYIVGFGILGTLIGILIGRYYPLRIPPLRWSGLLLVISSFLLCFSPNETLQTFSAVLLGISIFVPYAVLMTLPQELPNMSGKRITVIFSIFYSVSYLLSTAVLWLFGWLVDLNNGDFTSSFLLISIVSASLFACSFFLPETGKKPETVESYPPYKLE